MPTGGSNFVHPIDRVRILSSNTSVGEDRNIYGGLPREFTQSAGGGKETEKEDWKDNKKRKLPPVASKRRRWEVFDEGEPTVGLDGEVFVT
ncbi:Hypothetical protein NTJ_06558 [Nesidiocoris tenuis]|uniref:Uncharacterized protein n=1 Tax=Nesidiocoris tenuis TaxID=355587 RepID=A0ABN7AR27_9HEMI|nr:Hypothetical protein NTJ_06558 [Nesidiocoris tenuis]